MNVQVFSHKIEKNCADEQVIRLLHQTIKKVTEDLNDLRFNTSVSQLMIFTNYLSTLEKLDKSVLHHFLLLLNPFAPHLSEELNQLLGFGEISKTDWPKYDESKIIEETIEIAVQVNGKTRGSISTFIDADQNTVEQTVKDNDKINKYLLDTNIKKVIYIKGRIINFVIK